uniref:HAUS augmin-like complex subunit 3 N-terminal domain-containing protein n=1 Tax=Vitis vinifera TaxID=29760 RepID=F6I200_VITVI
MLTGQASALIQGRRARVAATSTVNGQLTMIDDSLSARNLQMNAVLGRIASTAQELAHYHSGDEDAIYLAYSEFHSYLLGDSACIKELNQWFVKQLDTGPFRLVAEEGKAKCSWVSLDDISNILVRDLEKSHHQRVSELQRLRSIFGTSERQWVEAQVENAKQQAILMTLKSQVTSDEAHIHLDLHSLRRKHSELVGELSNLYHKEEKLLSETIPSLCWELAQLQDTYILQGDYDLKVMRQEYYINRQKTVGISSLYYVSMNCKLLFHFFCPAKSDSFFYSGIRFALSNQFQLFFLPAAKMIEPFIFIFLINFRKYHKNMKDTEFLHVLCTLIQSLQQLLFASSTTAQPILTARPLMKELDEMEKVNAKLSAAVEEVTLEHCKKNEIVKHHSQEVGLQRRVFVDFFCNPERLRNQVRELTARVRAMQVS